MKNKEKAKLAANYYTAPCVFLGFIVTVLTAVLLEAVCGGALAVIIAFATGFVATKFFAEICDFFVVMYLTR